MSSDDIMIKRRRVARACDTCRRKKVRCDGVQPGSDPPSCTNLCIDLESRWIATPYSFIDAPKKRGPPKGYIEALETRLKRMESILGGLVQSGELPEGSVSSSTLEWINVSEQNFASGTSVRREGESGGGGTSPHQFLGSSRTSNASESILYKSNHSSDSEENRSSGSREDESTSYDLNDSMGQLAIDENGETRYLGNSSGIFLLRITKNIADGQLLNVSRSDWHVHEPEEIKNKRPIEIALPSRELCDELVDTYFQEIHPCIPFIDKTDFMEKYKDLENNPQVLGLLFAIMSVAARQIDRPSVRLHPDEPSTAGDQFFYRAKELLADDFDESNIITLQALLVMAMNQQGKKNSRCWLYTGMAIRMAQDMGLHRDSSKWNLDARQAEIRKRLWWACFMSDRIVSAGLGRPVVIQEQDFDAPLPIAGALAEDDPAVIETWVKTIQLTAILGRVIQHVYCIKSKPISSPNCESILAELDRELNEWLDSLPEYLRYEPSMSFVDPKNQKRAFFHLLFYTIQILLHRPHIKGPRSKGPPSSIPSLTICTRAANNITHISYRTMKEGGLKVNWTHNLYFFFTATVMHVINALSGDERFREVAKQGLRMSLKCLETLGPFWCTAGKCVLMIRDLLKRRGIDLDGHDGKAYTPSESMRPSSLCTMSSRPYEPPASNRTITFAPSQSAQLQSAQPPPTPTVPSSTADFDMAQQMVAEISSNANYSPSSASSGSPNFVNFGEFLSSDTSDVFFPPNADAFAVDVSSFIFDEEDPMGNGNPFWTIPSSYDLNDWSEYIRGVTGLGLGSDVTSATVGETNVGAAVSVGECKEEIVKDKWNKWF
ncbi:5751_t:CDS:2 [Paraglomus brasilianum]|uniref:5751_t:CDS:1 n=1 Tax=Paraglomus brasilianum TaxID=144538 RepID=A0A9N9D2X8_9GLOM|nr:5751_t:CDS:2 [Paraglomus brasilianum]